MNLLITGAWKCTESDIAHFREVGYTVHFLQNEQDALPLPYDEVHTVVCNGLFLYHDIRLFKNLKVIQLTSAGFDRVPMEYASENGVAVYNAKGVYSIPMSEYAVSGVLQLYKQTRLFAKNQSGHRWEKHRQLVELFGKSVCIVGCGSVGTECAKRFSAFGCNVVGVDLIHVQNDFFDKIVPLNQLDNVLKESDVVVLCLPLTKESVNLLNYNRLNLLKDDAVLVNIARGGVLDYSALIECLPNIRGAVLDVFETEPLPGESPLWNLENVIITPHNSFVGDGNDNRLRSVIYKNIHI